MNEFVEFIGSQPWNKLNKRELIAARLLEALLRTPPPGPFTKKQAANYAVELTDEFLNALYPSKDADENTSN